MRSGSSRRLAYAVSFPLMGVGSLAAHALAYRAVAARDDDRVLLVAIAGAVALETQTATRPLRPVADTTVIRFTAVAVVALTALLP
jgi:hypothetical protein